MRKVDELLEQARRLSASERRRLVEALEDESSLGDGGSTDPSWLAAMEQWLALAGTAHSEHTDVSSDKYRHLGAIYPDER